MIDMKLDASVTIRDRIDDLYRSDSRRVFASLVRLLKDFDLADDAMHEAYAAAVEIWQRDGVPANPRAWLISTGKFKAINALRRQGRLKALQPEIASRVDEVADENAARAATEIEDDRLRLIFTCCHPAIDPKLQVPLTLREVCGLTTEEIAHAFLTSKATMAQRIVRGKAKIRDAQIPYVVPSLGDLPERLDAVLSAIYLVFNEGYAASQGASLLRVDLTAEAIRLGRLLLELLPDPEAKGLLALMLLHESRRQARVSQDGEIILLEEQDRSRWDYQMISEGTALVEQALRSRRVWCVHAPSCHFGNPCQGRHRRPDGLESDCRALLRTAANRFIAGRRTQSGGRGSDAGRAGSGAGPDRCDSKTRGLGGLSPFPRGASGVVPALRKNVRREELV